MLDEIRLSTKPWLTRDRVWHHGMKTTATYFLCISFFEIRQCTYDLNVERSEKGIVSIERHQIRPHLSFHSALINTHDTIVIPLQ